MPMTQSPYRRGADDGFFFGAYLTVMFFASIFSEWMPLLQLLSGAMAVCVPLTIYRFMLRYHRSLGQMGSFPMLWMQGVVIFFCGMLLAGTALVVFMKWLSPDFVVEQMRAVAALRGTMPGSQVDMAADMAQKMLDANFVPSPIEIVTEMMMLAIVTGSLLSMVLSGIFALRRRREFGSRGCNI
ncbi:DUF4199 domain-containing protein [uncultured Duncaniella sp.]|nr:DUF4199 domain-containing protein [uncultured Duncaniella sp.]